MADIATPTRTDRKTADVTIARVELFRLKLPYKHEVSFRSVTESGGHYAVLRLVASDGSEGIAEAVARPQQAGEDAVTIGHMIDRYFAPLLVGADPMEHQAILGRLGSIKFCRTEKALIDMALWDLRGKLLGQPIWRLLGGARPSPIPLTWVAHGSSTDAMIDEACRMAGEHGYKASKLKVWKRSDEDVRMVRAVRKALGDKTVIYVDGNGAYSETEARTILAKLADLSISFIEEPCTFTDPERQASLARALPIALLGDQSCTSLSEVLLLVKAQAVGAVSVKPRRTGITNSLKIIALCEAAGIPVVIGTDSESRIGAQLRFHLRAGVPSLAPWPIETHFFDKLADDCFAGDFRVRDGEALPGDAPGFGAALDMAKIERYAL
jgi:L-alanine-DL-glutamate epimerase-like enolase superfamily enzyme